MSKFSSEMKLRKHLHFFSFWRIFILVFLIRLETFSSPIMWKLGSIKFVIHTLDLDFNIKKEDSYFFKWWKWDTNHLWRYPPRKQENKKDIKKILETSKCKASHSRLILPDDHIAKTRLYFLKLGCYKCLKAYLLKPTEVVSLVQRTKDLQESLHDLHHPKSHFCPVTGSCSTSIVLDSSN